MTVVDVNDFLFATHPPGTSPTLSPIQTATEPPMPGKTKTDKPDKPTKKIKEVK